MSILFITGVIMFVVIIAFLWLSLAAPASAGVMYKCSDGGKISYGDRPCPDGNSVTMTIHGAPGYSAQDQATLERQRKEVARIEMERAKRQAQADREQDRRAERARREAATLHKKCAALKLKQQWALEDARGVAGKQTGAASIKARRAAETLALECPA